MSSNSSPNLITSLEELKQLPVEQLVEVVMQEKQVIGLLQQEIGLLQQEIERLKIIIGTDSTTSSKPPSSDILKKPTKALPTPEPNPEEPPKRKPGGQPGHEGKTRKGFSRVDKYEVLRPEKCVHCGNSNLEPEPVHVVAQQVAQLVERPIEVVEYQRQTCRCRSCGLSTTADWPIHVIPGQDLDVKLQAFLGWLGNYGHLTYEKQAELIWELGQIEVGVGTLVTTNERIAKIAEPVVLDLQLWVKDQPHVHVDETPWIVKGIKEWLWVLTNQSYCVFHAGDTRSRAELEKILGTTFSGVISSDDLSVYNGYPVTAQQKCLAHMRRHVEKVIKFGRDVQVTIGEILLKLIDEAFHQYHQWQETADTDNYFLWTKGFKLRVAQTIKELSPIAGYEAGKILKSLRDKSQQWWYFLDHPEVPPDNNLAERALRLAVTKRKVSGGSRSMERFKQTAILLSVAQTCCFQGRSVLQFLRELLAAEVHPGQPFPSLIPPTPT